MKYDYFKANCCETRAYVKSKNLFMPVCGDDTNSVEEMWSNICLGLHTIRNNFIKLKGKNKDRCKWVTKRVRCKRIVKKIAWNKYKNCKHDKLLHKVYKITVAENRRAKTKFKEKLACNIKNDTKSSLHMPTQTEKLTEKLNL